MLNAIRLICSLMLMLLAVPLAGCAMDPDPAAPQVEEKAAGQQFLLSPGDTLKLNVYGDEQVTGQYMVDEGGYITMPLVGSVQANGKTKSALEKDIKKALVVSHMYDNPQVSVDVATLRPFYILGEVNRPGSYPFQPSLDVFQAVATAGGYTPRAAKTRITLVRGADPSRKRLKVDENTPVFPGDSIMIHQRLF